MKLYKRKFLSPFIILVAAAAVGCSSSILIKPERPTFTSNEQIVCAKACESIYGCCDRACSDLRVKTRWTPDNSDCVIASGIELEECYRACK